MNRNRTMRQLKILEHTSSTLFLFVALGTLVSLIVLYFLFTKNWAIALAVFILVDLAIFAIHKYTSNIEPKIVEINEKGIITNSGIIKYSDIHSVNHEVKNKQDGKMINRLNYLIIKTQDKTHSFYTNGYKNSNEEIVECIQGNLQKNK